MVKKTVTERYDFIDGHGDNYGYCALHIKTRDDGTTYAVIEAELPRYSEYTTWNNIDYARATFERDVEECIKAYEA